MHQGKKLRKELKARYGIGIEATMSKRATGREMTGPDETERGKARGSSS